MVKIKFWNRRQFVGVSSGEVLLNLIGVSFVRHSVSKRYWRVFEDLFFCEKKKGKNTQKIAHNIDKYNAA